MQPDPCLALWHLAISCRLDTRLYGEPKDSLEEGHTKHTIT